MSAHVCNTCKDTHEMPAWNGSGATWACTRCPVPCGQCRAGGNGAFCEKTPCGCACHKPAAITIQPPDHTPDPCDALAARLASLPPGEWADALRDMVARTTFDLLGGDALSDIAKARRAMPGTSASDDAFPAEAWIGLIQGAAENAYDVIGMGDEDGDAAYRSHLVDAGAHVVAAIEALDRHTARRSK